MRSKWIIIVAFATLVPPVTKSLPLILSRTSSSICFLRWVPYYSALVRYPRPSDSYVADSLYKQRQVSSWDDSADTFARALTRSLHAKEEYKRNDSRSALSAWLAMVLASRAHYSRSAFAIQPATLQRNIADGCARSGPCRVSCATTNGGSSSVALRLCLFYFLRVSASYSGILCLVIIFLLLLRFCFFVPVSLRACILFRTAAATAKSRRSTVG